MISESVLQNLLSKWNARLFSSTQSVDYKCALGECAYELQSLLDSVASEQYFQEAFSNLPSREAGEYIRECEADDYLSSMESHEPAA